MMSSEHILDVPAPRRLQAMRAALRSHWPEYLMEAALLGLFMISACVFTALLEYPGSPVQQVLPSPFVRRLLTGLAMGATAVALVYSPWGKQSGAHFNPAVTLTFYRLGRVAPWDAAFYVAAQFAGGVVGVMLSAAVLGRSVMEAPVRYVTTLPGLGAAPAFLGEFAISFLLMTVVLTVSNRPNIARLTGLCAGLLVATFITFEAPISGMSMNPARTFGSALAAHAWTALWIYFTAPPLAMLLAAALYRRRHGPDGVFCAKYHHQNDKRCIFCAYHNHPWRDRFAAG